MSRKKKMKEIDETATVTVKEFLEGDYVEIDPEETVFLKELGGIEETYKASDIPKKLQKRQLVTVQGHYGGVKYKYSAYRLIYKKR